MFVKVQANKSRMNSQDPQAGQCGVEGVGAEEVANHATVSTPMT